jgi:hypothetical protein
MTHISSIEAAELAKAKRQAAAAADARAAGCTCTDESETLCPCCIAWAEGRQAEMDALLGDERAYAMAALLEVNPETGQRGGGVWETCGPCGGSGCDACGDYGKEWIPDEAAPTHTAAQIAAEVAAGREPAFGLSAEVVMAALGAYERDEDERLFSEQRQADTDAMLQVDTLATREFTIGMDEALGYGRWVCYHRAPDAPYAEPWRLQLGGYVYKSYGFLSEVLDAQDMTRGNGCHHVIIGLAAGVRPPAELDADLGLAIMYGRPQGRSERIEAADLVTNAERITV